MRQTAGVPKNLGDDKDSIRKSFRTRIARLRRRADIDDHAKAALQALLLQEEIADVIAECAAWGMGSPVSVICARLSGRGWVLAMTGNKRLPTWDEVAEARWRLIPDNIDMAVPVPVSDRYASFHPNCIMLWEVQTRKSERRIITPYS